ncbi:hypothetical protein KSC_028510 [Ktedonobacter sp. SOSP1-52]|uniref:serine/threonine-protein kinase n=1 Tax=Ktedonobacter sp. SOSP1-52 TaxID=2778366 RepID=UPI001A1AC60E|nr:serine/threonine-protein kinase [Ktedonobacter sp. SOSP1-52]GHO63959.1 hypothetical protein KSC_028510 [Ktedonobacter sp. SOSP1-52]
MVDRVGQRMDVYSLQRLLGAGTFGDVYLGEQIYDHTQVAIKVLKVHLTQGTLKDFLQEARMIRLQHPHIVPILDFGIEKDVPFLAMAYAPNGTLHQRHPLGTRLPLDVVCSYVTQVAEALQYAHDRRLIHRDIKPQNMLLDHQHSLWLADFGIATVAHAEHSLRTQGMAGTVHYMAPEQVQGKPRPASDQYALAICVYQWLSGERPFRGTQWEIISQHLTASPPPLRHIVPSIPQEVEAVLMKALAKDPGERFIDIRAFASALSRACQQSTSQRTTLPREDAVAHPSLPLKAEHPSPLIPSPLSSPHPTSLPPLQEMERPKQTLPPLEMSPTSQGSSVNRTPLSRSLFTSTRLSQRTSTSVSPSSSAVHSSAPSVHHRRPTRKTLLIGGLVLVLIMSVFFSPSFIQLLAPSKDGRTAHHTGIPPANATATSAARTYATRVAEQGVMFGFDAAHTHWNPGEKILSLQNIKHLAPLWSFATGSDPYLPIVSSPAVANGVVYIGTYDGKLYAFDANCRNQCQPLWSFLTGGDIASSPAVANGMVYVGSVDGKLYAFDASCRNQCQPLWSFLTGRSVNSSPAVANGMVYVGSYEGKLYAF